MTTGVDNNVSNTFSRIDTMHLPMCIDHDELLLKQASDEELQRLLTCNDTSLQLQTLIYGAGEQRNHLRRLDQQ